ncbi:type I-E CRISPR-associated endonuclease Cas1e [Enorma burkinafasonensis]|uniref:type I-E CRISPR-associated endonuclease Cas1e n=1 Tax=Enorma burkinafasonensis TaxID=2590867 RepID=UPI0011A95316|nr:type I-E CRISPR-associated endonuclease Cas1e [Enorma burkinafasonensis]
MTDDCTSEVEKNMGSEGGTTPGAVPPVLSDLVRADERISFVYFERCVVNQAENAITITDDEGTIRIPVATLGVLMLGPGTSISHKAMATIGENGASVIWVGERGVRMYASGRPLTHSSRLLISQAKLVSNTRMRLAVARKMYQMRFPEEDVSSLTMQQLRGREGARIRRVYRYWSRETGVDWKRREFDPDDFDAGSEINKALSAAHTCLYGITHAVIVALGCSPGLGFVHTGHERSFVYDIADLYKAELSIPVAFKTAASHPNDIGSATRKNMRDALYDLSIMKRMVEDIDALFSTESSVEESLDDEVKLWDEKTGEVAAGKLYLAGPEG